MQAVTVWVILWLFFACSSVSAETSTDMWSALAQNFRLSHEENRPEVQKKMAWYLHHPHDLVQVMKRAAPWLYYISEEARRRHLPAETVLLPFIESAWDPMAINPASGAMGLWQMMPGTASGYGIQQNWWYDGRRDIVASTGAALEYLGWLGTFFSGDWLLAIAAYDAGEGTVLSAIRKNEAAGKSTRFWSLPLPRETKNYVPKLLALAAIISNPALYPADFPAVPNVPCLTEVNTGIQLDLRLAASLASISLSHIKQLNPGYKRQATAPQGPFKLILPVQKALLFRKNLDHLASFPHTQWKRYRIRPGETLTQLAIRFHTTPAALLKHNPVLGRVPKGGEEILVAEISPPRLKADKTPGPKKLRPGDTVYLAREGDTLEKIAKRYHVMPESILAWDSTEKSELYAGKKLILRENQSRT